MSWTDETTLSAKITSITTTIKNLEDSIAGATSADIQSYSINGRALSRYSLQEKIELHKFLTRKLRQFNRELAIENGTGDPGKHTPRF